jgi:hypothetical protein
MAAGQATQRDRLSGQTSLFDMSSSPEALERPLPQVPEALSRERLRWEKELLGLYLSEHPLGSIADQLAQYVTAYSSDLKDESLDGQRVVLGGIVTGMRTVMTRAKDTMAVATFEDLQGTVEVVVFPRMYVTSGATFAEGAILLVAGKVDHRGEEASLLADAVWVWEDAAAKGPATIAAEVAAGNRGRGGGRRWGSGNGNGQGNGNAQGKAPAAPAPAPPAGPSAAAVAVRVSPIRVSPIRGAAVTPAEATPATYTGPSRPSEPLSSAPSPSDLATLAPEREEPPLPDEARDVAARASAAPTTPLEAPESGILNVRFTRGAETSRIVLAMEELKAVFKDRPGATRVIFHIPGAGGSALPMELRVGVAYDAELLAEVQRRLGEGLVRLELSGPASR